MAIKPSKQTAKWFFLLISVLVLYLFWKIVEPYALALITAGIFAVILGPVEKIVRTKIKYRKVASLFTVFALFLVVLLPFFMIGVLVAKEASQAIDLIEQTDLSAIDITSNPVYLQLPASVQDQIANYNTADIGTSVVEWVSTNILGVFSKGVEALFGVFIFFIALYYFLVDRDRIYDLFLELSPLKDSIDADIATRIADTIRAVVFGSLIIATIQAVFATIGMFIFGVPGALLWGSFIIVAAQVPMLGVGLIMVPAIVYLLITGDVGSAAGLAVWSVVIVGLVDNFLSPIILGAKTKMPELLILISILGGIGFFGAIGLIVGPTILALIFVMIDLYKGGILEKSK